MYQFPIAAREYVWQRPWCIRIRVRPSAVLATRGYSTVQRRDVNDVV